MTSHTVLPATEGSPRPLRTGLVFWWAFASLMAMFSAWMLANPLSAAPDEPAHITKAGAVVRGELVGREFDVTRPNFGHVDVPTVVGFTTQIPNCFAFHEGRTAACTPPFPSDPATIEEAVTTASNYNPTYYAIVGLPTLVPTGTVTIYLIRTVSAALCALALAWGFAQAATTSRPDWACLGLLLALTPMVVYMSSAVNPASLEMTAAAALWVSFSVLVRDPNPDRVRSRAAGFAILASVLVNLRGLSPLFLAAIVVLTALSAPLRNTWSVLRDRRTWPWIALLGSASVLSIVWIQTAGILDSDGVVHHPDLDFWTAAQWSFGDTSVYLQNMLGQFGWVDTNPPWWMIMTIAVVIGFLVLMAFTVGNGRERLTLGLLTAFTLFGPVAIHAAQAKYVGIVWQGRYFLPAAVGLPVLSGFTLARAFHSDGRRLGWRASALLGGTWAMYQVCAFAVNWHRYAYGADQGWLTAPRDAWHAPVSIIALGLVLAVGIVGMVALCLRTTADTPRRDGGVPGSPDTPTAPDHAQPASNA